ncbi:histidine phosphatase family protein [Dyella soli]|uniref:Histidine phosphatase family protein n=1 Tax=Dyella soli TaxID=522319 RepID=A0A4R0YFF4_9GAMM|nr:histidine phosphatase family protein [Dyella soli]TCI06914.1 histidine phosphatase family protein [Dyella soli]
MRELLLIRHGQASFSAEDYDQLSPIGEQQSQLLGQWLAACGPAPDLVAMGPRRRHRDTAAWCTRAAGLDAQPVVLPGLDEVDHHELLARLRPDLEGPGALRAELRRSDEPHRAFQQIFAEAIARWVSGRHDPDYRRSWSAFREEVLDALRQLADHPAQTTWAFTSGGPIAVIASSLLESPTAQAFRLSWPLVNTGVTRLRLGSRGATLLTYNAWPHLERAGDAALVTLR